MVIILATPYSWLRVWVRLAQARDIDEQTITNIYPPRINDVHAVSSISFDAVWIYVEKVLALLFVVVGSVLMPCLVVLLA